jgi:hypothetical protein
MVHPLHEHTMIGTATLTRACTTLDNAESINLLIKSMVRWTVRLILGVALAARVDGGPFDCYPAGSGESFLVYAAGVNEKDGGCAGVVALLNTALNLTTGAGFTCDQDAYPGCGELAIYGGTTRKAINAYRAKGNSDMNPDYYQNNKFGSAKDGYGLVCPSGMGRMIGRGKLYPVSGHLEDDNDAGTMSKCKGALSSLNSLLVAPTTTTSTITTATTTTTTATTTATTATTETTVTTTATTDPITTINTTTSTGNNAPASTSRTPTNQPATSPANQPISRIPTPPPPQPPPQPPQPPAVRSPAQPRSTTRTTPTHPPTTIRMKMVTWGRWWKQSCRPFCSNPLCLLSQV